jgi:ParB family chromosome partitioning protein
MSEQRRLGRGLEALLSQSYQHVAGADVPPAEAQDDVQPGEQHGPTSEYVDPHVANPHLKFGPIHHQNGTLTPLYHDHPMFNRAAGNEPESMSHASTDATRDDGIAFISVHDITPNRFQPRQDFNEADLNELAESIRQHGVIQPIVVRRVDDAECQGGRIELISGERRLRAAILAGWERAPCWIREADDRQVAEIAIVENVQRKDLNPLEKAASFQSYIDTYGCTKEELATRVQIDRSTVANLIRLLELPEEARNLIRCGLVSQSHARALLPLGDEYEQITLCRRIVEEQLSVRAVEEIVTEIIRQLDDEQHGGDPTVGRSPGDGDAAMRDAAMRDALAAIVGGVDSAGNASDATLPRSAAVMPKSKTGPRSARGSHIASLEQELRAALGTKVEIREAPRRRGRGQIIVHFSSNEEFERLHRYLVEQADSMPRSEAG